MFALIIFLSSISDGSIIFKENGSIIVKNITHSSLTHTAIVFGEYVYESKFPRVRKTTIKEYLTNNKNIIIISPKRPYSKSEIKKMRDFAESQLDKNYSVKSYTRNVPVKGMHCSEYVSEILIKSGRYQSEKPWGVTPGSLWESIKSNYF